MPSSSRLQLGSFHRVAAIGANDNYISILNTRNTEFLIPYSPPQPLAGPFGDLAPSQTAVHLDHLHITHTLSIQASRTRLVIHHPHPHPGMEDLPMTPQEAFTKVYLRAARPSRKCGKC